MSGGARKRAKKRENRERGRELAAPHIPEVTDADLELLLAGGWRTECASYQSRTLRDGAVSSCSQRLAGPAGCPADCAGFEPRPAGGHG